MVGEAYNTSLWIYPTSALQGSGILFKFGGMLTVLVILFVE